MSESSACCAPVASSCRRRCAWAARGCRTRRCSRSRWLGKAPPGYVLRECTLEAEVRCAGFVDVEKPDVGAKSIVALTRVTVGLEPGTLGR